jgi:hypothetical protein
MQPWTAAADLTVAQLRDLVVADCRARQQRAEQRSAARELTPADKATALAQAAAFRVTADHWQAMVLP